MTKAEEGLIEEGLPLLKGEEPEGFPLLEGEKAEEGGLSHKEREGEGQWLLVLPLQKEEEAEESLLREEGEELEEGLPFQKGEELKKVFSLLEGEEEEQEQELPLLNGKGFRNYDLNRGNELKTLAEEKDDDDIRSKAELYHAAGIRYSLAKSWRTAATLLGKSAECYKELEYYKKAGELFMEAGKFSWKIIDKDAEYYFNEAVEQLIESNNVFQAAKYCERIGALYESSRHYDRSLFFYERWVDLSEATHDQYLIRRSKDKVAMEKFLWKG